MRPTLRCLVERPVYAQGVEHLIQIKNATFYKEFPTSNTDLSSTSNPPLFPDLTFVLNATQEKYIGKPVRKRKHVAVIGANPTPFLTTLQGGYICTPSTARTYPYLSSNSIPEKDAHLRIPSRAIKYVGFNSKSLNEAPGGVRGAYLSARYESRREETDWSLQQYLRGQTELNPSEELKSMVVDEALFSSVVRDLRLQKLLDLPVSHLSNGQTRRSRIAKALLDKPRVLLLDEPFMGLDPPTLVTLSPILKQLSFNSSPVVILGLRPQDPVPEWITHVVYLGRDNTVAMSGDKQQAFFSLYSWMRASEGGEDITSAESTMAAKLAEIHGPPPQNLPTVLTTDGIRQMDGYVAAWAAARSARHRTESGFVDPLYVRPSRQTPLSRALAQSDSAKSAKDWLVATTTLVNNAVPILRQASKGLKGSQSISDSATSTGDGDVQSPATRSFNKSEPLIELNSIVVKYGPKVVLGHAPPQPGFAQPGLHLTISRGTRLLLLGPNGSGKTTLLSLLTSDHPQSYSLPIKFFGRTRLPAPGKPGLSLWEIQSRIGHSSPEVHAFFPKGMTVRQVLESAWSETFSSKPNLTRERSALVDHFLKVWKPELCHDPAVGKSSDNLSWAIDKLRHPTFGRLPFATQRLLLLLRAIIKQPDIIILDEAFSGLPTNTRNKALDWLEHGDNAVQQEHGDNNAVLFPGLTDQQAMIVVSHVKEEIPRSIDEYIRLPSEEEALENGKTVDIGKTEPGHMRTDDGWNRVWGL